MSLKPPTLEFRSAEEWRDWLDKNHASSPGVWLLLKKKGSLVRSLTRERAWEEALCFGWIDSVIRAVDGDRFAQKFTPRRKGSNWSQTNMRKVEELTAEGRMCDCGLAAVERDSVVSGETRPSVLSPQIESLVKENKTAWRNYLSLPSGERLNFVHWIMEAKREGTRIKRAKEAIGLLAEGKRLGLK
ncbi:MAG: YdeI/OmpD-associated family protein [Methanomassiliicoccales archaeon]|jgi:uncharacterized protein YdeI (YjbR/CyaY-like superfamily)